MEIYVLLQSPAIEPGTSLHGIQFQYMGAFSTFELAERAIYDNCYLEDSLYWQAHNDDRLWIAEGVTKILSKEHTQAFKIARDTVDRWVTQAALDAPGE